MSKELPDLIMAHDKARAPPSADFIGAGLDAILNSSNEDEDLYQLIGCHPSSSVEQLQAEYKVRALQLHPDKNPGDTAAEKQFQQLQFAKDTLCDPERRATYDKWRASGLAIPFRQWLAMKDRVQTSMHWATPKTSGRMLAGQHGAAGESTSASGPPEGRPPSGESIRWGRPDLVGWRRSEGSDLVRKFRNYEI